MTGPKQAVLEYLRAATEEVVSEQMAFARIPSPDWRARERARYLVEAWGKAGLVPTIDKAGNVVAVRRGGGKARRKPLVLCAHMDSVFYEIERPEIRRRGKKLYGPGVCDDAAGVANLILLARALARFKIRTKGDLIFVGSVGEEGEGRLKGMRHFFRDGAHGNCRFVAVDGTGPAVITAKALASWSPRITVKGPGGHSYANFGRPNPIHMLARFVNKVTTLEGDEKTATVFNATMMSSGTAVNVIPAEATMTLNIRSSDALRLAELKKKTLGFLREAKDEELEWATAQKRLEVRYTALTRPGGDTPLGCELVKAASAAFSAEGLSVTFDTKSTDANMPMSLGIPAITIGAGGKAANVHSEREWHDITGRTVELAALARIVFTMNG